LVVEVVTLVFEVKVVVGAMVVVLVVAMVIVLVVMMMVVEVRPLL